MARILGEVDGAEQPQGDRHRHRDDRADEERPPEQRHRTQAGARIARVDDLRAPVRAEQEIADRHDTEEARAFEQQAGDDADR
ncbi:hypothetical protein LTR94_037450, partial [Friedmanniomyces endolithicus]